MALKLFYVGILMVMLVLSRESRGQQSTPLEIPGNVSTNMSSSMANRNPADVPTPLRRSDLAIVSQDFAKLKLASGFLLAVRVLYDSDFDGGYRIDQEGNISLPILGVTHVADETALQAQKQIEKLLLDKHLLKEPQVSLDVVEYTAPDVTILGEVTSPGKYPLLSAHSLSDVLALAGGPTITAGKEIQIISGAGTSEPIRVRLSRNADPKELSNITVHPGDTVRVQRAGIVYVLGAVTRPGGYLMQESGKLTVLQAVSLANGTTMAASVGTVFIMRKNSDGSQMEFSIPYRKITQGKAPDVFLGASDILYVPTSKVKASLLGGGTGILAAVSSSAIYTAAIY